MLKKYKHMGIIYKNVSNIWFNNFILNIVINCKISDFLQNKNYFFIKNKSYFFFKFLNVQKFKKKLDVQTLKHLKSQNVEHGDIQNYILTRPSSIFKWKQTKKTVYKRNIKYRKEMFIFDNKWKYEFLKKNNNNNYTNFLKNLKQKIAFSKFLAANFLCNAITHKKCNYIFNIFKNIKNAAIKTPFFFNKSLLFNSTTNKYNKNFVNIFLYTNKKKIYIYSTKLLSFFYYKCLKLVKPKRSKNMFSRSARFLKKKTIKRLKKRYWIKKTKFMALRQIHLRYTNKYIQYSTCNYNFVNLNIITINNFNNFDIYINYIFNIWNIRTYNWKQIT